MLPLAAVIFLFAGCEDTKETKTDPTDDLVYIGTQSDNGLTVSLYSDDALRVGLNTLYFQLTDDTGGTEIIAARIQQKPMMYMEDMKHSCPVTNPEIAADDNGLFTGEIIFIMASGMMGTWDDTITINNEHSGTRHTVVFSDLTVTETGMKKDLVFVADDSTRITYLVTLNGLETPTVGANDIILTVHRKASMMLFPEVADLAITVNPQMPDMGHGSTENIDPSYMANGKYMGTVVFNMTGYWTIDFTFSQNGDSLGTVQYEINF